MFRLKDLDLRPGLEKLKKIRFPHRKYMLVLLAIVIVTGAFIASYKFLIPLYTSYTQVEISAENETDKTTGLTEEIKSPAEKTYPDVSGSTTVPQKSTRVITEEADEESIEEKKEETEPAPEEEPEEMIRPVGADVKRIFGMSYSETFRDYRYHSGVDIKAEMGTPVKAALSGKVESVTYSKQEGFKIVLNHGKGLKTVYSHVGEVRVEKGQKVSRGDVLAVVAVPGQVENQLGPHLHFEVLKDNKYQNPLDFLPPLGQGS